MSKKQFDYYELKLKLISEQLGTVPLEGSIYLKHIVEKTRKQLEEANRLTRKATKILEKYRGTELTDDKVMLEYRGICNRYHEILGRTEDLPEDMEDLFAYGEGLQKQVSELMKQRNESSPTGFFRDNEGKVYISTHMILGNIKEIASKVTNNTTVEKKDKLFPSKVSIQEQLALDVKFVSDVCYPSQDVVRGDDGESHIMERPIRFQDAMGKTTSAIARSEYLPKGTEYKTMLRIRKDSPINVDDAEKLKKILGYGVNLGLGQWRGSGSKGQYVYKLEKQDSSKVNDPAFDIVWDD